MVRVDMRIHCWRLVVIVVFASVVAVRAGAQTVVVPLWPKGAPGSETWTQKESMSGQSVRNVVSPTITVYPAERSTASGAAVIIAPGGAFQFLTWKDEGTGVAEWLQKRGVTGIVLKYRVSDTGTEEEFAARRGRGGGANAGAGPGGGGAATGGGRGSAPSGERAAAMSAIQAMAAADGRQAIAVVRQRAAEWNVDPKKIGLLGFSAGGYVAVTAAFEHDTASRPDFTAAIYTCCVRAPIPAVPADAGPMFIAGATNDPISVAAGPSLFSAWTAAGKSTEIHIYAKGGHGFGMAKQGLPSDAWIDQFGEWLRQHELMK
jgi:acetyl esterase/lipase